MSHHDDRVSPGLGQGRCLNTQATTHPLADVDDVGGPLPKVGVVKRMKALGDLAANGLDGLSRVVSAGDSLMDGTKPLVVVKDKDLRAEDLCVLLADALRRDVRGLL
jgi:hypothetical protein